MTNSIYDLLNHYNRVIEFAIKDDDPKQFLECWREGDVSELCAWWPEFESDPKALKRIFHDCEITEINIIKEALSWFTTFAPNSATDPVWVEQAKKLVEE